MSQTIPKKDTLLDQPAVAPDINSQADGFSVGAQDTARREPLPSQKRIRSPHPPFGHPLPGVPGRGGKTARREPVPSQIQWHSGSIRTRQRSTSLARLFERDLQRHRLLVAHHGDFHGLTGREFA